jgi:hypothetical protein
VSSFGGEHYSRLPNVIVAIGGLTPDYSDMVVRQPQPTRGEGADIVMKSGGHWETSCENYVNVRQRSRTPVVLPEESEEPCDAEILPFLFSSASSQPRGPLRFISL